MKKFALLDKKSRTSIMYGVIICLTVAILFCIVKIAARPKVVPEDNNFYLPVKEKIDVSDLDIQIAEQEREVKIDVQNRARLIEDNVNIRSGPGTEYDRLGSAYKGFDYKIISGENDEWIKIEYDNREAYVFAEYVEVVPMFLNDMGEYEEYVELEDSGADINSNTDTEDSEENNSDEAGEDTEE